LKIAITGISGFVGRHVVEKLVSQGHDVIGISRDIEKVKNFFWFDKIEYFQADLHKDYKNTILKIRDVDVLIHLAWPGLPNYKGTFHIYDNLVNDLLFLKEAINSGIGHITIAGTCLEYGLQSGELSEEMNTFPTTSYGFAKDALRKSLEYLLVEKKFIMQWVRLFYMHGPGQNPSSLISQFDSAIDSKKETFNMSVGTQLRDYLSVQQVAENITKLIRHPEINGVINCCSGEPISVLDLILKRRDEKNSSILLNMGVYPMPDYEPKEFWGKPSKLSTILNLK